MSEPTPPSNTPPPPPNNPFIKKEFDEFTNKTTTTHVSKVKYETGGKTPITFEFQLRQVKTKDLESLLIDCLITKKSAKFLDRFQANEGQIIFNCDQDNSEAKYHKSKTSDSEKKTDEGTWYFYSEHGYYKIEQPLLKQICDAKVLKIRISGKGAYAEMGEKFCAEFQKYCKQFYNNVFDSSLYAEALVVEPAAAPKSGCFVATAAMGSYDDPAVQVLTHFRDSILLRSIIGRQAVHSYYAVSPGMASWMRGKIWVCRLAKWLLVMPASKIAGLMLKQNRCDGGK